MTISVECVVQRTCQVGEGACWDHLAQVLWWVDIMAGMIFRFDPTTGENREYDFGEPVGCLAVRRAGGLVIAAKSGFWFFDPDTNARTFIGDPEAGLDNNRFNDGTTDQAGRFWAGTMQDNGTPEPIGAFYRLDPDLTITKWRDGIFVTNGLAFSPDGARMYFSDSYKDVRKIWKCPYDTATGKPGAPEMFFDTNQVAGRPDGATVDSEGCYWQAGIEGWSLYRISPDGKVLMTVEMPIEKPSKPMFGGADLNVLYVTSLGVTPGGERAQPDAGGLFAVTGTGVTGVHQTAFAG